MLKLGAQSIKGFYLGGQEIKKAYLGENVVFEVSTSRLPSGYTELEYIESSKTQYIDVRFAPTTKTKAVLDVELGEWSGTNGALIGARNEGSTTAEFQFNILYPSTNRLRYDYFGEAKNLGVTSGLQSRTIIVADNNVLSVNGVSVTMSSKSVEQVSPYVFYLFAMNNRGNPATQAKMKLYSCQIYDNSTLTRDFVPCKNPSGTVGLYDLAGKKFYGNAGTGTFTAGPAI